MHELRENNAQHEDRTDRNPNLTLQRDEFKGAAKIELSGVRIVFIGFPIIGRRWGSPRQFN
jgi:hypothetical protein